MRSTVAPSCSLSNWATSFSKLSCSDSLAQVVKVRAPSASSSEPPVKPLQPERPAARARVAAAAAVRRVVRRVVMSVLLASVLSRSVLWWSGLW